MSSRGWATRAWLSSAAACVLLCGCSADQGTLEVGVSESELRGRGHGHGHGHGHGGHAGHGGGSSACVAVDAIDSMPDGIDEDCDGKVDEDVDYTDKKCPRHANIIHGTAGDDVIHGTKGRDCIFGYGGDDEIYGKGGDDLIFGGPGDDTIIAGGGLDVVYAGAGNDEVDLAGCAVGIAYGEAGHDLLVGGSGINKLFGGPGNDTLKGSKGLDLLDGGGCHDRLIGGKGIDVAKGGKGYDACDAEAPLQCERTGHAAKQSCDADADCNANQRCEPFVNFCVPKTAEICAEEDACEAVGEDDTCDGVDDDCDGDIDESFPVEETDCGLGACGAIGATLCEDGEIVDTCEPGTPSSDAVCNGLDDDCDGNVDDDFASSTTSCGVGACRRNGSTSCSAGSVLDSCMPGAPLAPVDTTCNGVDDECDGLVDDDFAPESTGCGVGVCARTGQTSCVGGAVQDSCVPGAPSPVDTCNGLDDDCDGVIDEGFVGMPTTCGLGACAETGATACINGSVVDSCQPGSAAANDATCDQVDDDCDGMADEDFASTSTSCGSGACTAAGNTMCMLGEVIDTCEVTCEGACSDQSDDDNDGAIDCGDSDCAALPECQVAGIGSSCTSDADCAALGSQGTCSLTFPGGYCYVPCDLANPGNECPSGSACWLESWCMLPCLEGDSCEKPGHVCGGFELAGLPPDPICHPTCASSCPSGMVCDPGTDFCF